MKDFMKHDLSVEQEIRDAFNHIGRVEREALIRRVLRKYR